MAELIEGQSDEVVTETRIALPRTEVAAYAMNPDNAPAWYTNIESIEWKTSPPLAVGSAVAVAAHFLGRRLSYTYEVVELVAGRRLVMRTSEGPFAMQTVYEFESEGRGATRMRLRNRGTPTGWAKLAGPLIAVAIRRANEKDLARLKALLEGTR